MPYIWEVTGNLPSWGWSGLDEIYIVTKNLNNSFFRPQLQETFEHETIHCYNRKVEKDLNYTTPKKNGFFF